MRVEEEYVDVLQNIEASIMAVYEEQPRLLDLDILDALGALIRRYTLEEQGRTGGRTKLFDRSQRAFDAIQHVCEWRLGRRPLDMGEPESGAELPELISVSEILLCLKRLRQSVTLWSREGGRQGYLNYVRQFMGSANGGTDALGQS